MSSTPREGRTLSGTLEGLLRGGTKDQLKVGDLMDEIEAEDGPGPVLFLLTLPVLLPTVIWLAVAGFRFGFGYFKL